jgi:enamine deaminase RidA (YjgF/YER057c/UK114 family)
MAVGMLEAVGVPAQAVRGDPSSILCVWLTDLGEFAGLNSVYTTFSPDPNPNRATVEAAGLVVGKSGSTASRWFRWQ